MKKRDACDVLGLDGIRELALVLDVKYDSLRSMKRLSPIHVKLVRSEVDNQFIKSIRDIGCWTIEATANHLARQSEIDTLVARGLADEEARANDSGLDN